MIRLIKKLPLSVVIIFLIPTILITLWFREGNILGTGESGLPFYDFNIQNKINKDAWAFYALGHPINIGAAAAPTYWLSAQLQNLGIPRFILQAVFLWLVLVLSGLSIYKLTRELFPKLDNRIYLLAPFFYWFNPFSLVNIWNRFLNNFIVFYTLLPLTLFLFIHGIRTKQYKYTIFIGLTSVFFSYALTSIAFDMLLWFILIYTTLFYTILSKGNNKFFAIKFFVLTFVFWGLANFWWISQVFSYIWSGSFTSVATTSFVTKNNYYTFYVLSERLGSLIDLFRLKHASFFANKEQIEWIDFYKIHIVTLFEFFITSIFLLPIVIKRKKIETLLLAGLLLLAIFFAKGNNHPLGELFDKIFVNFSFLQVFRNPFEKIAFILPLAAAPLFCIGTDLLIRRFNNKWGRVIYFSIFFWLAFIWGSPFWSGYVFTSKEVPTNNVEVGFKVQVPEFYKKASEWLLSQNSNFRLTVFPIGEEGITYTWPKGYSGVELSNQLLPVTSVSFNTNIPFYDALSRNLERIFFTKENFPKIMNVLNSKYITIRSDIDWKVRHMKDPETIYNRMRILESSNGRFSNYKQFGELSFWQNSAWQDRAIYSSANLVKAIGSSRIEDILQLNDLDVLYQGSEDTGVRDLIKSEIVHPSYKLLLGGMRTGSSFSFTDDLIFPAIRFLPSDKLYPLILLKEKIGLLLIRTKEEQLIRRVSLLGKRLMEVKQELEKNNMEKARNILLVYINGFKEVLPSLTDSDIEKYDNFLQQDELYGVFNRHLDLIKEFKAAFPEEKIVNDVYLTMREELVKNGIAPYFGYIEKPNYLLKNRIIYQFSIANAGNYELLIDAKSWDKYFKISLNEPILLQVDEELIFRKATAKKDYISFGMINFDQGKHEVAWNSPEAINLLQAPVEIVFKVNHGVDSQSFSINSFDPYSIYKLSFDYFIKRGSGVEVLIEQNNEQYIKDKIEPQFIKYAGPDLYNFDIKHFSEYFVPSSGADSAKVVFKVKAWNNCEEALRYQGNEVCKDEVVKQRFDLPTEIVINNIELAKVQTEVPFLIKQNTQQVNYTPPKISYTKINEAEYKVKVSEAKYPFILVLSELFDPEWRVLTSDGSEITRNHFLANTYANGWIVEKQGDYEILIKFVPQDLLRFGHLVSISTIMLGLGLVFFSKIVKNKNEK